MYECRGKLDWKLELDEMGEWVENVLGIIYIILRDECELFVVLLRLYDIVVRLFYVKFVN